MPKWEVILERALWLYMKIKVVWVGKTKNPWIDSLVSDYLERTRRLTACEIIVLTDLSKKRGLRGKALLAAEGDEIEKNLGGNCRRVLLDERGEAFGSVDFARWLQTEQNHGTRHLAFVLGGPEGLSENLASNVALKLSLGRMTWTHELARVLLMEQLYRAFSILGRFPYHR